MHFKTYVKPKIFKEAKDKIDYYQKNKVPVVAISACNDIVLSPLIKYLNFNHKIVTTLEKKGGIFTGKIVGEYVLKEQKNKMANKLTKRLNIDLKNAVFYSDSINDLPFLKSVGLPIVVNPDTKLKQIALKKGWELNQWFKTI